MGVTTDDRRARTYAAVGYPQLLLDRLEAPASQLPTSIRTGKMEVNHPTVRVRSTHRTKAPGLPLQVEAHRADPVQAARDWASATSSASLICVR
jgi:hypothetical protein